MPIKIRQGQTGEHEDDSSSGRKLAEETLATCSSENRLTGPCAKRGADVGSFSALEQDNCDQSQADEDVKRNKQCCHFYYELLLLFRDLNRSRLAYFGPRGKGKH